MRIMRTLLVPLTIVSLLVSSACGSAKPKKDPDTQCSANHTLTLGTYLASNPAIKTVYADLQDENGDAGDQAELERKEITTTIKPGTGARLPKPRTTTVWVINRYAPFSTVMTGNCKVEITVGGSSKDPFTVTNLNGTKVGKDGGKKINYNKELVVNLGPGMNLKSSDWEQ